MLCEPSNSTLLRLLSLYQKNLDTRLEKECKKLLLTYPKSVVLRNLIGAAYTRLEKYDEALRVFQKAIELNPNNADVYNNIGSTFYKKELYSKAISNFQTAIKIRPNFVEALSNLGKSYVQLRRLRDAETYLQLSLKVNSQYTPALTSLGNVKILQGDHEQGIKLFLRSIQIDPAYIENYISLATALSEIGELEKAKSTYIKALSIEPENKEAKNNLIELLKKCEIATTEKNIIIKLNNKLIERNQCISISMPDEELSAKVIKSLQLIGSLAPNLDTEFSQIYWRNGNDLNCKRHTNIFSEEGIIPKFCFGCYKIQVDVDTVIDLIRLMHFFYNNTFMGNPTTKCAIEMRPGITGTYKGFVYCQSLEQAKNIKNSIDQTLTTMIEGGVSKIKRGCTEFGLKFPEYENLDANDLMYYPNNWGQIEKRFDALHTYNTKPQTNASHSSFCLSDYLIIQKWVDYAKGINDPTSNKFKEMKIRYCDVYKTAKNRRDNR